MLDVEVFVYRGEEEVEDEFYPGEVPVTTERDHWRAVQDGEISEEELEELDLF